MPAGISIIIVSYQVRDLLNACLASVAQQETPGFSVETIVVDNASSDGSAEMVENDFPSVRLIASERNLGFSAANNEGMRLASGKYFFLLNPDTELHPGALRSIIEFAEKQRGLFLLGPRLLNSDGSLQISAWKQPGIGNMIAETFFLHRALHVSEYPREQFGKMFFPGMLSGAALFFPRELFETIGGLDPNLFWMEDADFSRRAKEADAELVYFPNAVITHHSGQSSKKNQRVVIANQLLSKLKYYRKYSGAGGMLAGAFFCFLHICSRIFIFGLLGVFSPGRRAKAAAYGYTFRKFFRFLFANDQRVT